MAEKTTGISVQIGGEYIDQNGYYRCSECHTKTMLVYPSSDWGVDEECYRSGEDTPDDVPDVMYVGEVSGRWCPGCEMLVLLSYRKENEK